RAAEQLVGPALPVDVGGDDGADAVAGPQDREEALVLDRDAEVHEAPAAPRPDGGVGQLRHGPHSSRSLQASIASRSLGFASSRQRAYAANGSSSASPEPTPRLPSDSPPSRLVSSSIGRARSGADTETGAPTSANSIEKEIRPPFMPPTSSRASSGISNSRFAARRRMTSSSPT